MPLTSLDIHAREMHNQHLRIQMEDGQRWWNSVTIISSLKTLPRIWKKYSNISRKKKMSNISSSTCSCANYGRPTLERGVTGIPVWVSVENSLHLGSNSMLSHSHGRVEMHYSRTFFMIFPIYLWIYFSHYHSHPYMKFKTILPLFLFHQFIVYWLI